MVTAEVVERLTADWSDAERGLFLAKAELDARRKLACERFPSAGALAVGLDPAGNRQVPWLEVVDEALEWAYATPDARLMISVPSQQGKSQRAVLWGTVRALMLNPDRRIIVATHSEDLARTHSELIRNVIRSFGTGARDAQTGAVLPDRLGISLGGKQSASRWTLAGHVGGLTAVGTGTALPGRPADAMILDDLSAGMASADSVAEQRRLRLWWDSVASQRLAPGAPIICIGTRWSLDDIFAYLVAQEPDMWRVLNFPAIAEPGVLDSLGREPGEPLMSARGEIDWEYQRKIKPARVWAATYQGHPVPTSGGLFAAQWFEDHRLELTPKLFRRCVAVDPAESGHGDEAGVVALGLMGDGSVVLTDDWSGRFTSDQWAQRAIDLALETNASEIVFEAYTTATTYGNVIRDAWVRRKAGVMPFRVVPWRKPGNAVVRSVWLRSAAETGKARMWGHRCAELERQAVGWLDGQHCPDRVAAWIVGFDHLAPARSASMSRPAAGWGVMPSGLPGQSRYGIA